MAHALCYKQAGQSSDRSVQLAAGGASRAAAPAVVKGGEGSCIELNVSFEVRAVTSAMVRKGLNCAGERMQVEGLGRLGRKL